MSVAAITHNSHYPWTNWLNRGLIYRALRWNRPLARLLLVLALMLSLLPLSRAQATPPAADVAQPSVASVHMASTETTTPQFPADGVYLYGQSPTPEELGVGYMVMEAVDQQVIGAFYMPHSSFDCFQGRVDGNELALTITNSYTQETYPYAISLVSNDAIASTGEGLEPLSLEGLYRLAQPSDNDMRILATCKAAL
ncbi:hypothetical protein [Halomicronema hongdechloris]|uniref:hypothetical protein n=1 Tax=Halomicronema hongdechloris TaxID=1209493 RepID=UPI0009BB242A|nr:hypothetical protein [Halomicronema hongdechloris]